jgi:hypothetical protein
VGLYKVGIKKILFCANNTMPLIQFFFFNQSLF